VVEALGDIKTADSYKALKKIAEKGDPSYYVEAAAIRSLGRLGAADLDGKAKDKKDPEAAGEHSQRAPGVE
jgi:aminopeptidase N